jgi:SAM-dependent methyltransferase
VGSCRELTNRIGAGCVDVAICNQVYEHVDSVVDLLAQLRQVLATHGVCYFAGPNLLWPIEPHVHLPFVHWLPRRAVIGVLQSIGVSRISGLDAWSLDVWRLQRLFAQAGFSARPAFSARARAGYALGEGGLPMRLAAALPGPLVDLLRPLLPAFVFILRKRP